MDQVQQLQNHFFEQYEEFLRFEDVGVYLPLVPLLIIRVRKE